MERTAILAAAFGRTVGPQMANMLLQGTKGIEAARKRGQELGIVLEKDLLEKAEPLQDQITELGLAFKAMLTRGVLQNAEVMKGQLKEMLDLAPGLAKAIVETSKAMLTTFKFIVDNKSVLLVILGAAAGMKAGAMLGGPKGALIGAGVGATATASTVIDWKRVREGFGASMGVPEAPGLGIEAEIQAMIANSREAFGRGLRPPSIADPMADVSATVKPTKKAIEDLMKALNKALETHKQHFDDIMRKWKGLKAQTESYAEAWEDAVARRIRTAPLIAQVEKYTDALRRAERAQRQVSWGFSAAS